MEKEVRKNRETAMRSGFEVFGGRRRRTAYAVKEAYGSLRRRCLAPLGLTSTRIQKGDRKRRRGTTTREAARRRCLFG